MEKNNRTVEIRGLEEGEWVWCLHCERAYQVGEFRQVGDIQLCPYEDVMEIAFLMLGAGSKFKTLTAIQKYQNAAKFIHNMASR